MRGARTGREAGPGDGRRLAGAGADGPREVLVVEGVAVRYGGETAVEVERLALREGELLAVVGPNGAGKSTLLRAMALLERPAAGRIVYDGRSSDAAERALRRDAAAVLQRPHLWSGSVAYNLGLALRLRGAAEAEAERRVGELVDALDLEGLMPRDASTLSAGQMQRVALARALAPDPRILFLDEPTSGLDAEARALVHRDLERFARDGRRSTLLVTHDRREAFHLADRIAVLEGGRLVQVGRPSDLYENPADAYIAGVAGAELALVGTVRAREEGLLRVDVEGQTLLATGRARPGQEVRVTYRPEDLVLAARSAGGRPAAPGSGTGQARAEAGADGTDAGDEPRPRAEPPPDDASVARDSLRNTLEATVEEVRDVRGLVRVRLSGPPELVAVVTRGSADVLELAPGRDVRVRVKAAALHAFPL